MNHFNELGKIIMLRVTQADTDTDTVFQQEKKTKTKKLQFI